VREAGAVPATIALLGGEVRVGLDAAVLEEIAGGADVAKLGARDPAPALVRGIPGATAAASTAYLAARAGHRRIRHRGPRRRASRGVGDLRRVGRPDRPVADPVVVVCAG
jgi:pseudouridine-5'-phosphate glycosidase